jgi:hypothetical protein
MTTSDAQHVDCHGRLATLPPVPGQHYKPVGEDVELLERPEGTVTATIQQTTDKIRLVKDRSGGYQEQYLFYELDRYVTGWLPLQGIPKLLFVTEVPLGLGGSFLTTSLHHGDEQRRASLQILSASDYGAKRRVNTRYG